MVFALSISPLDFFMKHKDGDVLILEFDPPSSTYSRKQNFVSLGNLI